MLYNYKINEKTGTTDSFKSTLITDRNWIPTKHNTMTLSINCSADAKLKALSIIETYLKLNKKVRIILKLFKNMLSISVMLYLTAL